MTESKFDKVFFFLLSENAFQVKLHSSAKGQQFSARVCYEQMHSSFRIDFHAILIKLFIFQFAKQCSKIGKCMNKLIQMTAKKLYELTNKQTR